jgi:hypothetical protein
MARVIPRIDSGRFNPPANDQAHPFPRQPLRPDAIMTIYWPGHRAFCDAGSDPPLFECNYGHHRPYRAGYRFCDPLAYQHHAAFFILI